MFKTNLIMSNHAVLIINKVYTYEAPVLYLIIAPLF
jgi:hypothetical protein